MGAKKARGGPDDRIEAHVLRNLPETILVGLAVRNGVSIDREALAVDKALDVQMAKAEAANMLAAMATWNSCDIGPDSKIVTAAVKIISPQYNEFEFRDGIARAIQRCSQIEYELRTLTSARSWLSRIGEGIDERYRAFRAFCELREFGIDIPGEEDLRVTIENRLEETRRVADGLGTVVREYMGNRGPRPDAAKLFAAESARLWLIAGGKRPALTVDGDFFQLASIIYEGATNQKVADLGSQCRTVLKRRGAI